jgi:hypothetical protein
LLLSPLPPRLTPEYEAAVADFSRTIDLGIADGTVFYLRALAQSELVNLVEAPSDMEKAVRLDPHLRQNGPSSGSPSATGLR